MKYSFQLQCTIEPDEPEDAVGYPDEPEDAVGYDGLKEARARQLLAERLQSVLENSTAREAISEGMQATVEIRVHDESPDAQKLRDLAIIDIQRGRGGELATIDNDAAVSLLNAKERASEGLTSRLAGHVQVWHFIEYDEEEADG